MKLFLQVISISSPNVSKCSTLNYQVNSLHNEKTVLSVDSSVCDDELIML